jgi:hypothetical protein
LTANFAKWINQVNLNIFFKGLSMRRGTKADLARDLGISRSAVSQAFKKHAIQLSADGKFDLDYAAWLLRQKQDEAKSTAQRSATKQLPGLKNPRLKREVVRLLAPIWEEAITDVIRKYAADWGAPHDLEPECLAELESWLPAFMLLWDAFHAICDREFPDDIGSLPYQRPASIDFDFMAVHPCAHLKAILNMQTDGENNHEGAAQPAAVDYSAVPLEELEPLVFGTDDALESLEIEIDTMPAHE